MKQIKSEDIRVGDKIQVVWTGEEVTQIAQGTVKAVHASNGLVELGVGNWIDPVHGTIYLIDRPVSEEAKAYAREVLQDLIAVLEDGLVPMRETTAWDKGWTACIQEVLSEIYERQEWQQ